MENLKKKFLFLSIITLLSVLTWGQARVDAEILSHSDTQIIYYYDTLGWAEKQFTTVVSGLLPDPFTFYMDQFDWQWIWNVAIESIGGGHCQVGLDQNVHCIGTVTWLRVSWQYTYKPQVSGNIVADTCVTLIQQPVDYEVDVYFPSYLKYAKSQAAPVVNEPGHLQFSYPGTMMLDTCVRYLDTRIKTASMPMIWR